jgi:hypothetical protein
MSMLLALFVLAAAGCGSNGERADGETSEPPAAAPAGPGDRSATTGGKDEEAPSGAAGDLCAFISAEEMSRLQGKPMTSRRNSVRPGGCVYRTEGTSGRIQIWVDSRPVNAETSAPLKQAKPLPEVGPGAEAGTHNGTTVVRFRMGDRWAEVTSEGIGEDKVAVARLLAQRLPPELRPT